MVDRTHQRWESQESYQPREFTQQHRTAHENNGTNEEERNKWVERDIVSVSDEAPPSYEDVVVKA